MNMSNNKKTVSISKVILWMIFFLVLYLPLVIMVLALVVGCLWGIAYSIYAMINSEIFLGIVLLLFTCGIGYFVVYPFCMGILRPFFMLYKSGRDERIEITESDAPELVALIHKIADLTKNEHPKHIYVSSVTNACVFFDSRFSNIFVPVKKNIEVGLGLFKHMSVSEIASCIAHEFGHFSQDTMRWGTVVHILNTLIANMMSVNERWNTMVNKLISFPWIIGEGIVMSLACKAAGWMLYGLTIGYMSIMEAIYKKIQIAYLELSRQMEYEADAVAAKIVGSDVYVSFANKLMEISKREGVFVGMAQRMASRNLLLDDYWDAFSKTDTYIANLTDSNFSSQTRLLEPLTQFEDSKLIFEAIYSSHPNWKSRIASVKSANYPKLIDFDGRAWDLIPPHVMERVSQQSILDLEGLCNSENPIKHVTEKELIQIIDDNNYWYKLAPYFQRDIVEFNYNACSPNPSFDFCSKESISVISRYNAAKADYDNAKALKNNEDFSKALYEGVVYKTSNLPLDKIEADYEMHKKHALIIDRGVCEYAMSMSSDIDSIKDAYRRLFYAQKYLDSFEEFVVKLQNETINILNKSTSSNNSHQYATIKESLEKLNRIIKEYGLDKMDNDIFEQSAPDNAVNCLNEYINRCDYMFNGDSISGDSINLLIYTCNWLKDVHENILSGAKMTIIDACLGRKK